MKKILFVCTGNTCRSPMAEAILRNYNQPDIEVKSAGVYAYGGEGASDYAVKVLDKRNIKHNHSSSSLKKEDIEWATYILTMTENHKQLIALNYPQAIEKTFTLKEFVDETSGDRDISDPFGGNEHIYEQTFQELSLWIEKLVEKLKN